METILLEKRAGVAFITLNRPHVRNAISLEMADELRQAVSECEEDDAVKVLVFTGMGDSFVSGGDLRQFMQARGREQAQPILDRVAGLLGAIDGCSKPTIAMINGHAIGGGCEFAVSCHFRFAAETAMLGFVQIGLSITTGWGGGSRLLDKLPESKALALLLTGKRISAREAERCGLVDAVYPPDRLREETERFAAKIAAQPLAGIRAYLQLLRWKRDGLSLDERIRGEVSQCAGLWGSDDHVRAVQRFLRKN